MKYNGSNLKEVLEAHQRWLNTSGVRTNDDRADLSGADLQDKQLYNVNLRAANLCETNLHGANLSGANLCNADLSGADIREAGLYEANFYEANLHKANLSKSDLCRANLYRADLSKSDLSGANLQEAYMYKAELYKANLRKANLYGANLREANLYEADLCEADIKDADLYKAELQGAKNVPFIPMACPDSGDFIGWKKCVLTGKAAEINGRIAIVKLLIPSNAERSSAAGRKCRASYAKVLEVQAVDGTLLADVQTKMNGKAISVYDRRTIYVPGQEVKTTTPFDPIRWNECASGIHFFINRQEAVDY